MIWDSVAELENLLRRARRRGLQNRLWFQAAEKMLQIEKGGGRHYDYFDPTRYFYRRTHR